MLKVPTGILWFLGDIDEIPSGITPLKYSKISHGMPSRISHKIFSVFFMAFFLLFLLEFLPKIFPGFSKNRSFFWGSSLRNLRDFCILTVSPRVDTDILQYSFQKVFQHCSQPNFRGIHPNIFFNSWKILRLLRL